MDIETYNRREEMLKLHEELLSIEEARVNGDNGYSVDEVIAAMNTVIEEIAKEDIVFVDYVIDFRQDYHYIFE